MSKHKFFRDQNQKQVRVLRLTAAAELNQNEIDFAPSPPLFAATKSDSVFMAKFMKPPDFFTSETMRGG